MPIPSPKSSHATRLPTVVEPSGRTQPLARGELIADRYRIDGLLGEGGMGAVYRAEHVHMRKVVALKVVHAGLSAGANKEEVLARFEREAIAAGHIEHPNVAAATDFGQLPDGSFFLVLEYVAGRTLRDELEQGRLEPGRAMRILRGIAAGLAAAHAKGIVHRDLKPENVMLVAREDDRDFVKILDFGIAKLDAVAPAGRPGDVQPLTRLGAVLGTPDYMSPEQALGQPVDARTDLYALGVILFEMITGDRPFHGGALSVLRDRVLAEAPPELPADVAAGLDARVGTIVRRLLMRNADARFQTASELSTEIEEALGAGKRKGSAAPPDPISSHPSAAVARALGAELRARLRPRAFALAIAIAIGAVLVLCLGILLTRGPSEAEPRSRTMPGTAATAVEPTTPVAPPADSTTPAPDYPPPPTLPPPPSPAVSAPTRSAKPESSAAPHGAGARRTGPGGIYIPPPSQWFR